MYFHQAIDEGEKQAHDMIRGLLFFAHYSTWWTTWKPRVLPPDTTPDTTKHWLLEPICVHFMGLFHEILYQPAWSF